MSFSISLLVYFKFWIPFTFRIKSRWSSALQAIRLFFYMFCWAKNECQSPALPSHAPIYYSFSAVQVKRSAQESRRNRRVWLHGEVPRQYLFSSCSKSLALNFAEFCISSCDCWGLCARISSDRKEDAEFSAGVVSVTNMPYYVWQLLCTCSCTKRKVLWSTSLELQQSIDG